MIGWEDADYFDANRWKWFKANREKKEGARQDQSEWKYLIKTCAMPGGSGLLAIIVTSSSSPAKWKWMRLDAICFRIDRGWAKKVSSLQQRFASILQNFIIYILHFLFSDFFFFRCCIYLSRICVKFLLNIREHVCFNLEFSSFVSNFLTRTILDIHLSCPCLLCKIIVIRIFPRYL